jgi:hypothetical protein
MIRARLKRGLDDRRYCCHYCHSDRYRNRNIEQVPQIFRYLFGEFFVAIIAFKAGNINPSLGTVSMRHFAKSAPPNVDLVNCNLKEIVASDAMTSISSAKRASDPLSPVSGAHRISYFVIFQAAVCQA